MTIIETLNDAAPAAETTAPAAAPERRRLLRPTMASSAIASALAAAGAATQATQAGVDGVDHIHVSYIGKTELGRELDATAKNPFVVPVSLGEESIDLHYACVQAACLHGRWPHKAEWSNVAGPAVAKLQKACQEGDTPAQFVQNQHQLLGEMYWLMLQQNAELAKQFASSSLPFRFYHEQKGSGVRTPDQRSAWLEPLFEELRRALRAGFVVAEPGSSEEAAQQPDFTKIPFPKERARDLFERRF